MYKDSSDYAEQRKKNKKTPTEEHKWLDGALAKLKKAATELKRQISNKLKKTPSVATLWLYTQYLIMRFYSEIQLRNDLGNVSLADKENQNYLKKIKGGRYNLIMRDFKASRKVGVEHNWLLSNSKGQKLSKPALGKSLRKLTGDRLDKSIGTRMLRIFNASDHRKIIEQAAEISNNMLHSQKTSKGYVRK